MPVEKHKRIMRKLERGDVSLEAAVRSPDAAYLTVGDLLTALPNYGEKRAADLLAKVRIAGYLECRHVTDEQLQRLTEATDAA